MATWRVFKKQDRIYDKGTVVAVWAEFPPIESEYDYSVSARDVGAVDGAGHYMCISTDKYPRTFEIEVVAETNFIQVPPPRDPADAERADTEPGYSVAVPAVLAGDDQ